MYLTSEAIDINSIISKSHLATSGALVIFCGDVRNRNNGKDVLYLEYEGHTTLANKVIEEVLSEAKAKWNLDQALCLHRTGKVLICESAVIVITSSPHRREAYEANQYIIDRIKHEAPIWKCEYFTDGTHQWGNNCSCH